MFLEITGFLKDDNEDDSIKFELDVHPQFEQAVMDVLGWESLKAEAEGDLPLTTVQIKKIAATINEHIPTDLDMFIGVRA